MIKTCVIDDIWGISQLLMEQRYRPDLDRYRSLHIYRGMPNADFNVVTSLQRVCKHKRRRLVDQQRPPFWRRTRRKWWALSLVLLQV